MTLKVKNTVVNNKHRSILAVAESSFMQLKIVACESGRKNDASLKAMSRHGNYDNKWHHGHIQTSDEFVTEGFKKLKEKHKEFSDNFQKYRKEYLEQKGDLEKKIPEKKYNELKNSVASLFQEIDTLRNQKSNKVVVKNENETLLVEKQAKINELKKQISTLSNGKEFPLRRVIASPDNYRTVNEKYVFGNKKIESVAWDKTFDLIHTALSRPITSRLFILVGVPCSGKSQWANDTNNGIPTDKHPVILDSTNLSDIQRQTLARGLKKQFDELETYCVYFDTDIATCVQRNNQRSSGGEPIISNDSIRKMYQNMAIPDPLSETWIDALMVVRA